MSITPIRATDRRALPRAAHPFDGSCSSQSGNRAVRISDLSVSGCFVESLEPTAPGERLQLSLNIPNWGTLELTADVVYASAPIGFGVRFVDMPPASQIVLQATIDSLLKQE